MRLFILIILSIICLLACGSDKPIDDGNNSMMNGEIDHHPDVHFSLDYADDIANVPDLSTQQERDAFKDSSLIRMQKLFDDFYDRFHFAPNHQIHVVLSEAVEGHKNIAYTTTTYNSAGDVIKLSMHFPYVMFVRQHVLAHELTHAFVAPFHLPTWANEGFAVYVENDYTREPAHPIFANLEDNIRLDDNGVNAVQHWTEGKGIYADIDLTLWCYRYAHTLVDHIDKTYPGAFDKLFDQVNSHSHLSTKSFISILDEIVSELDVKSFFLGLKFADI